MEASTIHRIAAGGLVLLLVAVGLLVGMTGSVVAQAGGIIAPPEEPNLEGEGTEKDPYVITNVSGLEEMRDGLGANYTLGDDIDATPYRGSESFDVGGGSPIADGDNTDFSGSLYGNNRNIFGFTMVDQSKRVGLFGSIDSGKVVNISFNEVTVISESDPYGEPLNTGALAGEVYGNSTIKNITVSGTVNGAYHTGGLVGFASDNTTIQGVKTSVNVSNQDADLSTDAYFKNPRIGGLVGVNHGAVRDVYASGNVNGSRVAGGLIGASRGGTIENATATGRVNGSEAVGGLVGSISKATIKNATAKSSVNGSGAVGGLVGSSSSMSSTVQDTFAVGSVAGVNTTTTGGLIGVRGGADIQDSYWDINTTGQTGSAGNATGLTTAQMTGSTAQTYMPSLEFGSVWQTQPDDYPAVKLQYIDGNNDADDNSNQSDSVQVQLSNVRFTPQFVNSNSESTHQLTFEAQNVSADGESDVFYITFPNKVDLVNFSDVAIDEKSSDVNRVDNTLEFSVDPTGGGSTQISGKLNVTVSATN